MRTRSGYQAKHTERIIKNVFPEHFKLASDKQSNGYKYINLLFGVEIDEFRDRLQKTYNNLSLDSIDLSDRFQLFELTYSGLIKNESIYGDGILIEKVSEDTFYNGDPTRVIPISGEFFSISGITKPLGIEFFRINERGSGYYIFTQDINHDVALSSGVYANYRVDVDSVGSIVSISGFNPGVVTQDFETQGFDEIVYPELEEQLRSKYPDYRKIVYEDFNGIERTELIEHYEPYLGFYLNQDGKPIPETREYQNDFYFDENGKKIYFKTALNNPYGSGNYTSVFVDLQQVPISGTVEVYDIDILDSSGNAIKINKNGSTLYKYENSNEFDPIYVGYDPIVPFNNQFISAGELAVPYKVISWDYVKQSGYINDKFEFVEPPTANISNRIRINNPNGRYLVKYKYLDYRKNKYITSTDSTSVVRIDSDNKIYSLEAPLGSLEEVSYEFTRDPRKQKSAITFDALDIRPGSKISRLDISAPGVVSTPVELKNNIVFDLGYKPIGFSDEFVPKREKNIKLDVQFDNEIINGSTSELDHSTNEYSVVYYGNSNLLRVPFSTGYAKRITYQNISCGYNIPYLSIFDKKVSVRFGFKFISESKINLLESSDSTYFMRVFIDDNQLHIQTNGLTYTSRQKLQIDNRDKDIIILRETSLSDSTQIISAYIKDSFFTELDLLISTNDITAPQNKFTHVFYDSSVIARSLLICEEV